MKKGVKIALRWIAVTCLGLFLIGVVLTVGILTGVAMERGRHSSQAADAPICAVDAGKLLGYINTERLRLGAPELRTEAILAVTAKGRLDDMVQRKYFSHVVPDNQDWAAPIRQQGVNALLAEDLGSNDLTPEQSWQEFKDSADHYKSLVDPRYTRVGIATECTDYMLAMALTPEDQQYIGSKVTDLTVIHLAAEEPAAPTR